MADGNGALPPKPSLRADAQRNRERILVAARDLFVERGADAPLEEIASRAEVGIGTLYRRFPDREALMVAVVREVLGAVAAAAAHALEKAPDAFQALVQYMHGVLDLRASAVVPELLGQISLNDPEITMSRQRAAGLIEAIIERGHDDGTIRADLTSGDVSLLMIRMSRPLPGPIAGELADAMAHRHLDLLLDGLRPDRGPLDSLTGPALSLRDLRTLIDGDDKPLTSEPVEP